MAKAQACHSIGDRYRGDIAFCTQPGHIPERARVIRATEKAFEHAKIAEHHEAKAAGTERMLETTIFSDDENAIEAIQAKAAGLRAQVERMKAANKIIRKFKDDKHNGRLALEQAGFTAGQAGRLFEPDFAGRLGFPSFELTNTGANIRRLEGRIVEIERRKARTEKAESSGGVTIEGGDWVRVTFSEKPEYSIIATLKAAGFRWGGGSWTGERVKIPAEVLELIPASDPTEALNDGFTIDAVLTAAAN
jgi:hypothetical protein